MIPYFSKKILAGDINSPNLLVLVDLSRSFFVYCLTIASFTLFQISMMLFETQRITKCPLGL